VAGGSQCAASSIIRNCSKLTGQTSGIRGCASQHWPGDAAQTAQLAGLRYLGRPASGAHSLMISSVLTINFLKMSDFSGKSVKRWTVDFNGH
jgi:hypothetical protein